MPMRTVIKLSIRLVSQQILTRMVDDDTGGYRESVFVELITGEPLMIAEEFKRVARSIAVELLATGCRS